MYGSGRKLIQFYTQPRIDKKFESITSQKAKSRTVITVVLLSTLMNRYILLDTFNSGNIYVGGRTCVLTSPSNKEVMFWHDLITKKFDTFLYTTEDR